MNYLFENNESGAVFSDCKKYRYRLWRIWDNSKPLVMFIGLNPSTATASKNDNTVTKVCKVAKNNGFGGFYMMNLFALISPYPEDLLTCDNPIMDNDSHLKSVSEICGSIVFCWGNFRQSVERAKFVQQTLGDALCFVQNKNGSPKHPLYCKDETILMPFKKN